MGDERPHRTLRLALAMRGGVSLAVWIGGAVAEIDVLRRHGSAPAVEVQDDARRRGLAYDALLRACGYGDVEVDVLAGASAGGLNSVLYGTALVRGTTIDHLDRTWIGIGGFWKILRGYRLTDPELRSLLSGDAYFAHHLRDALLDIAEQPHSDQLVAPNLSVDLSATLLDAGATEEASARDGRGHIHVARRPAPDLADGGNPLTDLPDLAVTSELRPRDRTLAAFAYAGRTTSSFPFAFEPARLLSTGPPVAPPGPTGTESEAPAPVEMSRWFAAHRVDGDESAEYHVVDGGVLDNIPVDRALRAIQSMPAGGPTRRTLLFLDPDPAVPVTPPSAFASAVAVLRRVMTIRGRGEQLSDELEAIRAHNEREVTVDGRFTVVTSGALVVPTDDEYARVRNRSDAQWALGLLRSPAYAQLRSPYDALAVPALDADLDDASVMRELGRRRDDAVRRRDVVALADATALLIDWTRGLQSRGDGPDDSEQLATIKAHLYRVRAVCRVLRQREERGFLDAYWSEELPTARLDAACASLSGGTSERAIAVATVAQNGAYGDREVLTELGRFVAAGDAVDVRAVTLLWDALERRYRELADVTQRVTIDKAGRLQGYATLAPRDHGPDLASIVSAFTVADAVPATSAVVDFHVVGGDTRVPDPARFPELLAAARRDWLESALRGDDDTAGKPLPRREDLLTAAAKLAGNNAANFSGFLAARWRRNDWWWGRRDAAVALVRILTSSLPDADDPRLAAIAATLPTEWPPGEESEPPAVVPKDAVEQLCQAVARSVERERVASLDPGAVPAVTEGAERFRNLRPVYLSGVASRATDLTWRALVNGLGAVPSRWARAAILVLLVAARPVFALVPLAANAVRAMVVGSAAFAALGVMGGLGRPGSGTLFFWIAITLAALGLVGVVYGVVRVRNDQEERWGALVPAGTDRAVAWVETYQDFRRRGSTRATWMILGGIATVLVPLVVVPAVPSATRPVAGGILALVTLVWCLAAWRAVTAGPAARRFGWTERDRNLRYLGIAVAVILAIVGLVDVPARLSTGTIVGLAVAVLAAGATAALAGGWARPGAVVVSAIAVGAGTGAAAMHPLPVGWVIAVWLALVALASFCWPENDLVEAQDGERQVIEDAQSAVPTEPGPVPASAPRPDVKRSRASRRAPQT